MSRSLSAPWEGFGFDGYQPIIVPACLAGIRWLRRGAADHLWLVRRRGRQDRDAHAPFLRRLLARLPLAVGQDQSVLRRSELGPRDLHSLRRHLLPLFQPRGPAEA